MEERIIALGEVRFTETCAVFSVEYANRKVDCSFGYSATHGGGHIPCGSKWMADRSASIHRAELAKDHGLH